MARHPLPGHVKTRLARVLGERAACELYRAFVLDLAARLRTLPYPLTWAYWPPDAPFASLVPGSACRPQRGRDLGERLRWAIDEALAARPAPVLVVGADCPHLPLEVVDEAAGALAAGADVVLGPAEDGGYYLVGIRRPIPELLSDIAWGTPAVLEQTLAHAASLGLRSRLLPPSFDIDRPEDLDALRTMLTRGDIELPHTAAALAILRA